MAVAERVAEVASRKNRFTVEDLGDVRTAGGGDPVSGCQAYLRVAWFQRAGGRAGTGLGGNYLLRIP